MTTIADVHAYVDAGLTQSIAVSDGVAGELDQAHQMAQSTLAAIEQLRDAVLQQIANRSSLLDELERRIATGESDVLPALVQLSTDIASLTSALSAVPQALQDGLQALADAAAARAVAVTDAVAQVANHGVPTHTQSFTAVLQQDLPATIEQARALMLEGRSAAEVSALRAQASAATLQQLMPGVTDQFVIDVASGRDALTATLSKGGDDLVALYGQQHSTLAEQISSHASMLADGQGEALHQLTDQVGRVRESIDKLKAVVSIASAVNW